MSKNVFTARQGHNAELFSDIMNLYVPKGASVLDATWGRGKMWDKVAPKSYRVTKNDLHNPNLDMQADFRRLPVENFTFDAEVLDPPYAQHGTPMKPSIANPYGCDQRGPTSEREMLEWYRSGAKEAYRVLKPGGTLIIKTQDAVESGKQVWKHAELLNLPGFQCEDLFVLVQMGKPAMRHTHQKHARKNHSYFLVHRKI